MDVARLDLTPDGEFPQSLAASCIETNDGIWGVLAERRRLANSRAVVIPVNQHRLASALDAFQVRPIGPTVAVALIVERIGRDCRRWYAVVVFGGDDAVQQQMSERVGVPIAGTNRQLLTEVSLAVALSTQNATVVGRMAILHEYVSSSDKSGFYIRDGIDGNIVTYQLAGTAENLLSGLEYKNGDQIPQELINLLHRLRLIYTHRSGIEPPESLRNLTNFKNDEISELSSTDREKILQFLLDHASLSEDEHTEVLEYAHRTDADVVKREMDEGQPTASSPPNGDLPPTDNLDSQSQNDTANKPSTNVNTNDEYLSELEIECGYCDEIISATEYVEHVRQSGSRHGDVGSFPKQFLSEHTPIVETAAADVMYPDDLEHDFEYYPVCRQCGKRFVLLGSHKVHENSSRRNVDEFLHNENTERDSQPLLLPFTSDWQIPIAESRLAKVVTEVALSNLDFASTGRDSENRLKQSERTGSKIPEKDEVSVPEQNGKEKFEERITEYECAWVLTDLARFLTVLGRHYENEEISEPISNHYDGVIKHARKYYGKTKELPGSLREYRTQWERPEIGVRVPREVLEHIGVGDYRGEIFLPAGYCYPVDKIHQRLETAWLEQAYPDKTWTMSTDYGKNVEDHPSAVADSKAASNNNPTQHSIIQLEEDETDIEQYVPLSVLNETISKYKKHEVDGRQASWFHAAEILRQTVKKETDFDIQDTNDR